MNELLVQLQRDIAVNSIEKGFYKDYMKVWSQLQTICDSALAANDEIFNKTIREIDLDELIRFGVISCDYEQNVASVYNASETLEKLVNLRELRDRGKLTLLTYLNVNMEDVEEADIERVKKNKEVATVFLKTCFDKNYINSINCICKSDIASPILRLIIEIKKLKQEKFTREKLLTSTFLAKKMDGFDVVDVTDDLMHSLIYFEMVDAEVICITRDEIIPKYKEKISNINKVQKKKEKEVKAFKHLQKKIDEGQVTGDEIGRFFEDFDISERMQVNILEDAVSHNISFVKTHEQTLTKDKKYKQLFLKYRYDYDKINDGFKKIIETIDLGALEDKFTVLAKTGICLTYSNLSYILQKDITGDLELIEMLLNRKYINTKFINNNIDILVDNEELKKVCDNILLLADNGAYDIDHINYKVLRYENSYLKAILDLYHIYDISICDNVDLAKLLDVKNFDIIDSLIEENIDKNVIEEILCRDDALNIVKRIHINNLIEADSLNDDGSLGNEVKSNKFFVANSNLDKLSCNHVSEFQNSDIRELFSLSPRLDISEEIINSNFIKYMDENYLDQGNYNIGGNIISRVKVLRNLECLKNTANLNEEALFDSIIYNSMLSVDELYTIKDSLQGKDKKRLIV